MDSSSTSCSSRSDALSSAPVRAARRSAASRSPSAHSASSEGSNNASTPRWSANAAPCNCASSSTAAAIRVGLPSAAATRFSSGIIVQSLQVSRIQSTMPTSARAAC